MAAPQWKGGKCKSVQQAKAFFRHNDRDRRAEVNHTNPHIDKSKTHENFTYRGLDYKALCKAFDDKLASVDVGRESTGKNARVVLQSVVLYPPKGLTREQEKDWFMDAGRVMEAQFGDNLLEIQFDMDEEHEYPDAETGEMVMSRNHGHARLFPEVDGKLNGKAFSCAATMKKLNHALDVMSVQQYGVHMMDGTQKKGGKTVEALKAKSLQVEVEMLEERAATIITDALDTARNVTTDARKEAQEVKRDADDYAYRTRRKANQTAQEITDQAEEDAEEIRAAARKDAEATKAQAEKDAQAAREAVRAKLRAEIEEAKQDRDKIVKDRNATVAALQGDYKTWATLTPRPTATALLRVLGAAVEASRTPPASTGIAAVRSQLMEQLMRTAARDAGRWSGNPGPTHVEGPTV